MLLQLSLLFTSILSVFTAPVIPAPSLQVDVNSLPSLTVESSFLIDTVTGDILFTKEADKKWPIASITKLMMAVALLDNKPDWDKVVRFEARDRRNGDVNYLIPGEEIAIKDAWNLMLTASSNDATALLARTIFGNEDNCVSAMNGKARGLGLSRTMFIDPIGLSPENVSTAREVAILARYALSFSEIRQAVRQSKFIFVPKDKAAREIKSTNQMLKWFQPSNVAIFGGKTGHIKESGYNLVFSAGNKKHEFIGVVLGSKSNETRFKEMGELLKWGFQAVR